MSVHIVALVVPNLYLSPGERVPDGAGAWIQSFDSEREAHTWILSPERSTYYAGDEEAVLVIANAQGEVL